MEQRRRRPSAQERHASEPPCVDDETATLWVAIPSKPAFEGCSPEPEGRERENGAAMRPPRLMTDTQTRSAHRTRLTAPLSSFVERTQTTPENDKHNDLTMNYLKRILILSAAAFCIVTAAFPKQDSVADYKHLLHDFYGHAGRWYVGALDIGYNYSFAQDAHTFTAAFLSFRYKMFAASLLSAEFAFPKSAIAKFGKDVPCEWDENYGKLYDYSDEIALWSTFVWKPTISLVFPARKDIAVNLYAGVAFNLIQLFPDYYDAPKDWRDFYKDRIPYFSPLGGVSLCLNFVPVMPIFVFVEYRYPFTAEVNKDPFSVKAAPFDIKDKTHQYYRRYEYFRVGVSFSFGVHL